MKRATMVLWGFIIVLLLLNLVMLYSLNSARLAAINSLSKVEILLDELANEVIIYSIKVDQAVPIEADVPLQQSLNIPLNTVIPIDQVLTVPFQMGDNEIELEMPLKLDFPVDMVVPVDFNETISIDTTVQLDTTVPVEIDIAQTPLSQYLTQARSDVRQLKTQLAIGGEIDPSPSQNVALAAAQDETESNLEPTLIAPILTEEPASAEISTPISTPTSRVSSSNLSDDDIPDETVSEESVSNNTAIQPDVGPCTHLYWPFQKATTWYFNNSKFTYSYMVDDIIDSKALLSAEYEGLPIEFEIICQNQELGGIYLGDMRRITELGDLTFHNPRGVFLPSPEIIEKIGIPWTQEFDIKGELMMLQNNQQILGSITQGKAVAQYTPTGLETLDTPLGSRQGVRIEQKLELALEANFDSVNEIEVIETIKLINIYWFVKGVGLVKTHWQGGMAQREYRAANTITTQEHTIPALTEEQLISVCILFEGEQTNCIQLEDVSGDDLTLSSVAELDIQSFSFDDGIVADEMVSITPEIVLSSLEQDQLSQGDASNTDRSDESSGEQDQLNDNSKLLEYSETIAKIGDRINEAGENFGEAAVHFQQGKITFNEFEAVFKSFKPKAERLINEIDRLTPPDEANEVHKTLTNGLKDCNKAIDLMDDWFEAPEDGTKEATALLVFSCLDKVEQAEEEMKELLAES